jgi:hypothetical protein
MATVGDNVAQMAELVRDVKKKYMLQEQTILRIIDMTIALAQQATMNPEPDEIIEPEEDNVIPFPTTPEESND